ncbi:MAG TPA: Gfo/Idh/MocA family oxidoreductase [Chloroflexota bacterium]|nr:Gfo/Idh/MocA family oxidoreductase [Chloroflexota bacterium]
MKTVGVGIVGAGWGANHARVVAELGSQVAVRALCARRRERLLPLAGELGLPEGALETSWERLVERADIDLVVVTAPDALHHPISMAAIRAGKAVFCEKPLAMDAVQAREMLDAATAAGVPHFTGYTWRFAPPFATMRRLLGEGVVGPLRFIDGHFRIGPPLAGKEWQHDPRQRAGGVLGNLGVHLIDLCRAFLLAGGAPAEVEGWRVWARTDLAGRAHSGESGSSGGAGADGGGSAVNDLVWLQLQMGAGRDAPQARLQASQLLTLRAPDPVRVELHGARASLAGYANPLAPEGQRVALWERTSTPAQAVAPLDFPGGPPSPPSAALPSGGLLRPTVRHLYEGHILPRLLEGVSRPDTPTFRDGWLAQRVMDAALRAAEEGSWVAA